MAMWDRFNPDRPRQRDDYFTNLMGPSTPTTSMTGPSSFTPMQPSAPSAGANPMAPLPPRADSPYGHLQNPGFDDPATNQLMQFLGTRFGQLTGPQSDPFGDTFAKMLTGGMTDALARLSGPAFSDPQLAQLRTGAFDSLAHQNQQDIERKKRELAQRGITPTSGLYSEGLKEVGQGYQQQVGQTTQHLANYELDQQNARTNAAFNQAMSLGQAMNSLGQGRRMEQNNNLNQALALMQLPVGLTSDRLSQMVNVLNGGGQSNPSALMQTMLTLGQMNNQQNNYNHQQNQALWSALGPILANLPIGPKPSQGVGV